MPGEKFYLTIGECGDGRILAVISDTSPAIDPAVAKVRVFSVETFNPPLATARTLAREWFARMLIERPWETRQ